MHTHYWNNFASKNMPQAYKIKQIVEEHIKNKKYSMKYF